MSEQKDRRIPLRTVAFNTPTALPGVVSTLFTVITAGERRVVDGKDWLPPPLWLDKELRVIKIDGRSYPLERVHYFEQSVAALTKSPPPIDLDKFTLGKRPAALKR